MTESNVVQLKQPDPELAEEARLAAEIAAGILNGDSNAESQLVERYSRGLRYLLTRRMGDGERARDLLQDTFVIAITKLRTGELEYPERLAGYLRGIAIRVAMNAGRRRQKEPVGLDIVAVSAIPDEVSGQFDHLANAETRRALRRVLESLSPKRYRDILRMLYLEDKDRDEICAEMGEDPSNFYRTLSRARKSLGKKLESSGIFEEFG